MDTRIIIEGQAGIGKSWLALQMAEELDPLYKLKPSQAIRDRVFFTAEGFMQAVQTQPTNAVLIYDEAGQTFHHREFMSGANIILSKTMIGYRFKRFITILCIPNLTMVDKDARTLSQFLINVYAHGKSEVYTTLLSKFGGEPRYSHLINVFSSRPPQVKLRHAYEIKKQTTQKEFYKKWGEEMKLSATPKVTNSDLLATVKATPDKFSKPDSDALSIPLLTAKLNIGRDRAYSIKANFESDKPK